jgi:hypothetical protein
MAPYIKGAKHNENIMLRQKFGPNKDDSGEWIMLHNEGIHGLYRSPNVVKVSTTIRL